MAARCFGLYDDDNIIGFLGVLHRPNHTNLKLKGVTRLVILPDYQGIGLGGAFLEKIAKEYVANGWDFIIRTSAKNLITKLYKDKKWIMYDCSIQKRPKTGSIESRSKAFRDKNKAASFKFVG